MAYTHVFSVDNDFPTSPEVDSLLEVLGTAMSSTLTLICRRCTQRFHFQRGTFDFLMPGFLEEIDTVYETTYRKKFLSTVGKLEDCVEWQNYCKQVVQVVAKFMGRTSLGKMPLRSAARLKWWFFGMKDHAFLPFPTATAVEDVADLMTTGRAGILEVSVVFV